MFFIALVIPPESKKSRFIALESTLQLKHLRIVSSLSDEIIMPTSLYYLSLIQEDNIISLLDRLETMRYDDHRTSLKQRMHRLCDSFLTKRI